MSAIPELQASVSAAEFLLQLQAKAECAAQEAIVRMDEQRDWSHYYYLSCYGDALLRARVSELFAEGREKSDEIEELKEALKAFKWWTWNGVIFATGQLAWVCGISCLVAGVCRSLGLW
jgi:hypothetical protein